MCCQHVSMSFFTESFSEQKTKVKQTRRRNVMKKTLSIMLNMSFIAFFNSRRQCSIFFLCFVSRLSILQIWKMYLELINNFNRTDKHFYSHDFFHFPAFEQKSSVRLVFALKMFQLTAIARTYFKHFQCHRCYFFLNLMDSFYCHQSRELICHHYKGARQRFTVPCGED